MKKFYAGRLLNMYVEVCIMVGAVWVGVVPHRKRAAAPRPDLEAFIGGMLISGAAFALWFMFERPLVELGRIGDGIEGFALGASLGYIVTGILLAWWVLRSTYDQDLRRPPR